MDNNLFDDLVASIKEAGAIKRNEIKASRVTELELPDIKEVREKTGLTQSEFAARLHISARTLQNWEQGRRYPTGPAARGRLRERAKSYAKALANDILR